MDKGSVSVFQLFFSVLILVIMWFMFLGKWINDVTEGGVTANGLTGIEAFGFLNLNFIIFVAMLIAIMAYVYASGANS